MTLRKSLALILLEPKVTSLCHQYRPGKTAWICEVWPCCLLLAVQLQVQQKLKWTVPINGKFIIPFKKFIRLRVIKAFCLAAGFLFSIRKLSFFFSHDPNNLRIMCTDSIVFYEKLEVISPRGIRDRIGCWIKLAC